MRFYKIITNQNKSQIDTITNSMSSVETDYIIQVYEKIHMVEYTDVNGFECVFVILDVLGVKEMSGLYKKYSIKFDIIDLTEDIIRDNPIKIKFKNDKENLIKNKFLELIKKYKLNWITKDDILDKIIDKGIKSLTKFDLEVLKS